MKTLLLAIALLFSTAASAEGQQRLADPAAARALTDQVMAQIAAGKIEAGMRLLKPYMVVPENEFEVMLAQASLQVPVMNDRFGKSVGSEFLRQEQAGDHLIMIQHLNLLERTVTRWNFIFYKTPTGWAVNAFAFDDKVLLAF